jgi:predicted dehydrogenase
VATSQPLRCAVIGVGHLGRHHARLLAGVEGAELVAVVDSDAERAAAVAEPLGVPVLATPEELPDDVAAVSVAVPTSAHQAVVEPLLRKGVHVLVEKPMAASLDEARSMEALAAEQGLVLHVGHVERFNPALAAFRKLDATPRFIEAHRLAPFNYRTLDTSVVMDLMIHDIDIVLSLARAPLAKVDAVGSRVLGQHVDIASARLTFEDGCVANLTASRVSFEPMRKTRVFADEAFVSMDLGSRRAFVVSKSEGFDLGSLDTGAMETVQPKDTFKEFVAQGLLDMEEFDLDHEDANPLRDELATFVAEVRGGPAGQGVDARAGLAAMEVAAAVSDSIAAHRWADA